MVSNRFRTRSTRFDLRKKTGDLGRLIQLTFKDGGLLLGFEGSILSLLLLPPFVPVIVLGLTRRPVVLGEHFRCSSSHDRWPRKVPRLPASHFLVRPSIIIRNVLSRILFAGVYPMSVCFLLYFFLSCLQLSEAGTKCDGAIGQGRATSSRCVNEGYSLYHFVLVASL